MLNFFAWYMLVSFLGWLTFPLAYRLFPALADRGFTLARALSLLVWGYVFWLLASLGIIQNDSGGLLLALLVLAGLSAWAFRTAARGRQIGDDGKSALRQPSPIIGWLKSNLRMVVTVEVVFFLAFAAWAFVRASNPNIEVAGGEKVMEVAFINAILRSPTFPPHDPWLSGYAISYYYFGYVMTAMFAKATGTLGFVAHNLMSALIFALTTIGAYGILYNLLAAWNKRQPSTAKHPPSVGLPWLAPLFLLIVGNLEGFLEILYRRGLFWKWNPDGTAVSSFWHWLNLPELQNPPIRPLGWGWLPNRITWNLTWQASRVIQDCSLVGSCGEVIDEFPAFSFLQGDLHPHVLAIPFGLLAVAVALNLFLGGWQGETKLLGWRIPVRPMGLFIPALVLGGLFFMNAWDILSFTALILGVHVLMRIRESGWTWSRLGDLVKFAIPLGVLSIALYLPFVVSFSSEAGGILPNLISPTRGAHLWLMFGPLFILIFAYLAYLWRAERLPANWLAGGGLAVGGSLLLWLFSWLLGLVANKIYPSIASGFVQSQGFASIAKFFAAATERRFVYMGGWLTLVALLAVTIAFLARRADPQEADEPASNRQPTVSPADIQQSPHFIHYFILLLILIGSLLVLAPDYVYLRDMYGNRGNTVFKFYFQAWILWSVAAAFGTSVLLQNLRRIWGWIYRVVLGIVLLMALSFFAIMLPKRANDFQISAFQQSLETARAAGDLSPIRTALSVWTLDGAQLFQRQYPDDAAAAHWLAAAPLGVVAEAVSSDSYSNYGRMAVYSGQPDVLGWPGHVWLWHGASAPQGSRQGDIQRLYETDKWDETQTILLQYRIRYVYIGSLERSTYRVNETKFQRYLTQVYQSGDVVIYEVPEGGEVPQE